MGNPNEPKSDRFDRLASARVETVLDWMRKIGQLSARNNYDYTRKDVDKIEAALEAGLTDIKLRFDMALNKKPKTRFKL